MKPHVSKCFISLKYWTFINEKKMYACSIKFEKNAYLMSESNWNSFKEFFDFIFGKCKSCYLKESAMIFLCYNL